MNVVLVITCRNGVMNAVLVITCRNGIINAVLVITCRNGVINAVLVIITRRKCNVSDESMTYRNDITNVAFVIRDDT